MLLIRPRAPRNAFERFRLGAGVAIGSTPAAALALEHAPRGRTAFDRFAGWWSRAGGVPQVPPALPLPPGCYVVTDDGTHVVTNTGVYVTWNCGGARPPRGRTAFDRFSGWLSHTGAQPATLLALEHVPRGRTAFDRFSGWLSRSAVEAGDFVITEDGRSVMTEGGAYVTWGDDEPTDPDAVITEDELECRTDDDVIVIWGDAETGEDVITESDGDVTDETNETVVYGGE